MSERRTNRTGLSRLRPLVPIAIIWTMGLTFLVGLALQRQVPYDQLLLDPNNVAGIPWYTGLVSSLGILGWTTATVTGFFGAWVAHYGNRPAASRMLFHGAVLSAVLLFDDLLQLHVILKPAIGIPKMAVYVTYLVVALWWVVGQWRELRRTRSELLVAAGGAFAVSIGLDQVADLLPWLSPDQILLLEDAAKFLGVLAWAQFFTLTSGAIVTSIVTELRQAAAHPLGPAPTRTRSDDPPLPQPDTGDQSGAGAPVQEASSSPSPGASPASTPASSASSSA